MTQRPHQRGFTLIEAAVVTAIILILAALAWANLWRQRPRANLANAAAELSSLILGARQQALASGHNVAVLFFPQFVLPNSAGRVIVYEDGSYTFFNAGATPNFGTYDAAVLRSGDNSRVYTTMDLPHGVIFGQSELTAALPAPLDSINVLTDCSFCAAAGDRRGAIVFDGRGRVSFHSANGAPTSGINGGSVSLVAEELRSEDLPSQRTILIMPTTGTVRVLNNG